MPSGLTGANEFSVVSGVEAGATGVGVAIVVLEVVVAGFGAGALAFGFGFVSAFVVAVLVFGAGAGWGAGSGFGLVVAVVVGVTSVVGPVVGGGSSASAGATSAGSVTPSAKTATNRPACAALIRALPSTLPSALLTCAPNAMWNQNGNVARPWPGHLACAIFSGAPYGASASGTSPWKFSSTASTQRSVTAVPFSVCTCSSPCSPR